MATRTQQIGAFLAPLGIAACGAVGFAAATIALRDTGWIDPSHGSRDADLIPTTVLMGLWATIALAIAGGASGLIWRWRLPTGALAPAAAWAAAALAACPFLDWNLSPNRSDFAQTGPAIGVWLIVGVCALIAPRRTEGGPLGGWWTVPARVLVAWALTYGVAWASITLIVLSPLQAVEDVIMFGLLGLAGVACVGVLAAAIAAIGPIEPGPQFAAFLAAGAGITVSLPDTFKDLKRAVERVLEDGASLYSVSGMLGPVLVASGFVALAGLVSAVAIWLRYRHNARSGA